MQIEDRLNSLSLEENQDTDGRSIIIGDLSTVGERIQSMDVVISISSKKYEAAKNTPLSLILRLPSIEQ